MKKNRILIPAFLLFFLLTGCSNLGFRINPTPIPEGMDETATVQAACDIVTLLSNEDYQAVVDKFRDDVVFPAGFIIGNIILGIVNIHTKIAVIKLCGG